MKIEMYGEITPEEFLEIIESVGWKTYTKEQIKRALKNTMYLVKATVDGNLAGMGRVVGDKGISCMLTNICVKPEFQHQGIGTMIVFRLKQLIEEGLKEGERVLVELSPTSGNENFYKKAGFKYKPEVMIGMYLWLEK